MKHLKEYNTFKNDNFKNWFGNSKIVDKQGKPMIMYHGSPHIDKIEEFENEKGYHFFTSSKWEADRYTPSYMNDEEKYEDGKYIKQFYIKALKPFDPLNMTDSENISLISLFKNNENMIDDFKKTIIEYMEEEVMYMKETLMLMLNGTSENVKLLFGGLRILDNYILLEHSIIQEWIKSNGYDSYYTIESGGDDVNVAVYNSNQIKSINNNGNFSNSPNINEDNEIFKRI